MNINAIQNTNSLGLYMYYAQLCSLYKIKERKRKYSKNILREILYKFQIIVFYLIIFYIEMYSCDAKLNFQHSVFMFLQK